MNGPGLVLTNCQLRCLTFREGFLGAPIDPICSIYPDKMDSRSKSREFLSFIVLGLITNRESNDKLFSVTAGGCFFPALFLALFLALERSYQY